MNEQEKEFSLKQLFIPFTTLKAIHFIVFIGLIVFGNGLFNHFVGDDNSQILQNPAIQSISNIPKFFFENRLTIADKSALGGYYYKPLFDVWFTLSYSLAGQNYFFYHLFQIFLHIANSCLLFFFFTKFFKKSLAFILSLI